MKIITIQNAFDYNSAFNDVRKISDKYKLNSTKQLVKNIFNFLSSNEIGICMKINAYCYSVIKITSEHGFEILSYDKENLIPYGNFKKIEAENIAVNYLNFICFLIYALLKNDLIELDKKFGNEAFLEVVDHLKSMSDMFFSGDKLHSINLHLDAIKKASCTSIFPSSNMEVSVNNVLNKLNISLETMSIRTETMTSDEFYNMNAQSISFI